MVTILGIIWRSICVLLVTKDKKNQVIGLSVCMINDLALIYNQYTYYLLLNWIMSSDSRNL